MDSYARSCYPMAVQAVRDAISKDSLGQTKEAYCCYLSSILFMIQALKDEAWEKQEIKDLCHDEAFKLYKLTEQSLGRARDILNAQNPEFTADQNVVQKLKLSPSMSTPVISHTLPTSPSRSTPVVSHTLPTSPSRQSEERNTNTQNLTLPPHIGLTTSLPSPPGYPVSPVRSTIPKSYQTQKYDMFQAYQHRKSKDSVLQKYTSCNNNMSMFREMAEKKKLNDIKEKAYQEKMLKRRQEIKIEAERRWNQRNTRLTRDKEYRQDLLENILAYEQDAKWPITLRDTLVISSEDTNVIVEIIRTILTYNEHPLCKVLKEVQYDIYCSIEPLIKDFELPNLLSQDYYLMPVQSVPSTRDRTNTMPNISQSDPGVPYQNIDRDRSQTLQVNVGNKTPSDVSPTDKTPSDVSPTDKTNKLNKFNDLEDDMFSSESEPEDEGNFYNSLLRTSDKCQHTSEALDKDSNSKGNTNLDNSVSGNLYDHLMTDGAHETLSTETVVNRPDVDDDCDDPVYQDPHALHARADPLYEGLTAYQENIYEDVNEVVATIIRNERSAQRILPMTSRRLDSEFLKSLDRVVQDILFGIDRLHSVIILTYEILDSPIGRDMSYANLESIFFKPIWPWLIRLFRKMNIEKEEAMAEVMNSYKNCGPSIINIREKLTLQDDDQDSESEPYSEAIEEMKQLVEFTSPLDKLECTVRMSKAICHCVETFYTTRGKKAPSVGCDDLLPIVSYVVLKSQLPQIVSECHAMTEFIHDGYLMGEEGYCLTTLHAAISNLLSFAKPRK